LALNRRKITSFIQRSQERLKGFTSEGIPLFLDNDREPVRLHLPPNLYFVGTVNMDETTRSFSPKVLDRAFVIEFDSDLEQFIQQYPPANNPTLKLCKVDFTRCGKFFGIDREKIKDLLSSAREIEIEGKLKDIHKTLKKYGLHFGYRTFEHVMMFIINAKDTIHRDLEMEHKEALDVALYTKVLPKYSGPRSKLERPLNELLVKLCGTVRKGSNEDEGNFTYKNNQLFWKRSRSSSDISSRGNEGSQGEQGEQEDREPVRIESLPEKADGVVKFGDYKIETEYPLTVKKIIEMLYRLQTEDFASFL